jgi:phenylacetaldehyde dehydrogenase
MTVQQLEVPSEARTFLQGLPGRLYIDGEWVDAVEGGRFATENPADETTLGLVAHATDADVDLAVAAAERALRGPWGDMLPAQRSALLHDLASALEANAREIAMLEVLDNGKALAAAEADVAFSVMSLRFFAGAPTRLRGQLGASAPDRHKYVRREPVGVCALITAWNYPLVLAIWKVGPALASGSTAVLKPAEQTPLTALRLVQLAEEVGIPAGVLNLLTGDGDTGRALVGHPGVRKISFTGSTVVGQEIAAVAAKTMKRLTLELGGKSPNIIFPDADLEKAIAVSAVAGFKNSGQTCSSGSRIYVHEQVADRFLEGLVKAADAIAVGPGLDESSTLGPLISAEQRDRVCGYLEAGHEAGFELAAGGETLDRPGYFVRPTVFANATNDAKISREEIFGPVVTVHTFASPDEALALANDTTYGLAAAVWTRDLSLAHRMASRIQAGTVWVNSYGEIDPSLPYGGFKNSGLGRDLGDASVESFTELKTVSVAL